ncbi:hypothetical protein C8J57DRAFT_1731383 [Mycena rebaudengoi]|nr:hypothetical protein C8J57DRAFT_1731383 [Mycena rebaudengoi]
MSTDDLRKRLAHIDASISLKKAHLKDLETNRAEIQYHLDRVVYPVLTLPAEITSAIFVECLDFSEENTILDAHPNRAPLVLMHVCRMWRSIAISTRRLWAALRLTVNPENLMHHGAFIDAWFGRAGELLPLSLALHGEMEENLGPGSLRAILRRHAPQLQCVGLEIAAQDIEALEYIGPFPLLQKLIIGLPFDDGEDLNGTAIFSSDMAPLLHEIVLTDNALPTMFDFRAWEQLTKLSCGSMFGDEGRLLLAGAPHLVECSMSVYGAALLFGHEDDGAVEISTMKTFSLVNNSWAEILRHLNFPALQNLHIADVADLEDSYFIPFLTRSSASLRSFSFGGGQLDQEMLSVGWFTIMSNLTRLELRNPGRVFEGDFFPMLNRGNHAQFLPHLQALEFVDCTEINNTLLRALTSRCGETPDGGTQLKSFQRIYPKGWWSSVSGPTLIALRGLVARGMEIHVV